jgi:hypothetical protein
VTNGLKILAESLIIRKIQYIVINYINLYVFDDEIGDSARILRPLVTFAEHIFNELNLKISYFALLVSNGD